MKDLEKKRSRTQDPKVTKSAGNGNAMGMMDTIVTFQNGAFQDGNQSRSIDKVQNPKGSR